MWTYPKCSQQFVNRNHPHSCNERTVEDFLEGKSEHTVDLFHHFINEYRKICDMKLHPTRYRIGFAGQIRFGYVNRLGRDFVDISLTFDTPYEDNYCFYRIGVVPGEKYFQHYLRIYRKEDVNEEVKKFMRMAWDFGNKR